MHLVFQLDISQNDVPKNKRHTEESVGCTTTWKRRQPFRECAGRIGLPAIAPSEGGSDGAFSNACILSSGVLCNRKDFEQEVTEETEISFPGLCYLCLLLLNSGLRRFAPGAERRGRSF
ncbi:hypothetical protein SBV1_2230027 [Verrucomicrobia bacterium]|nr:hypothetical protein SBV1_2230027 [Verrucomicrobiota bacterium]